MTVFKENLKENLNWVLISITTIALASSLCIRLGTRPPIKAPVREWGYLVSQEPILVTMFLAVAGVFGLVMATQELNGKQFATKTMVFLLVFAWIMLTISFGFQELFGFGVQFTASPILSFLVVIQILINAWELKVL